jgi:lycopene cyclase-like protein
MAAPADLDVLVVGGGPAALAISTALAQHNLAVGVLSSSPRGQNWANTYGIWGQEVDELGLQHLLSHRWSDTRSHFGSGFDTAPHAGDRYSKADGCIHHGRDYGLFDKQALQQHWLELADRLGVRWWHDGARSITHAADHSSVGCDSGTTLRAQLVVDASGHQPVFVSRPTQQAVAGQAAYGLVARFAKPPIHPGHFVFMDYRCAHLEPQQRLEPPTFLYAMHLEGDVYFVEETSLALAPPVPFAVLKQRLQQRLAHSGAAVTTVLHEEFCLFPMDPPLPDLRQRVVGFGGAGGMVHPASGYMVGSLLRRAPALAACIAASLRASEHDAAAVARQAWQCLWPLEMRLKHGFYRFGLSKLMGFDEARLRHHFHSFFQLPDPLWYGFLTNTLSLGELALAMAQLFALAPWDVRAGLLLPARRPPGWQAEAAPADIN